MQPAPQAETAEPTKVFKLSDEMAEILEKYHPLIEKSAGVRLSRTKALEWCIRTAIAPWDVSGK